MNRILLLSIFAAAVLLPGAGELCAQRGSPDRQQAILLDNGYVLEGQLIDEGDRVLIRLGPGSQLRLPRGRIRTVGANKLELFRFQHRQLRRDDVQGRKELAHWCLRQELRSAAGQVVAELIALAPSDPQVAVLESTLRRSLEAEPDAAAVQPASHATPARPATEPEATTSDGNELTPQQLTDFTQHVQPILINHCSATGCHGVASKSEFELLRPFNGRRLTYRMTSQNLRNVMEYVDQASPLESRLLTAATQSHAGRDTPLIAGPRGESSLAALKGWLNTLGNGSHKTDDEDGPGPDTTDLPTTESTTQNDNAETETRPESLANLRGAGHPVGRLPLSGGEPDDASATGASEAADPYDANVFNRRYFPERFEQRSPFQRDPDQKVDQDSSNVNTPDFNALRNATLLESSPESSRTESGGNQ